jgi:ABC-type microcin C transport system permease subunit YejE
MISAARQLKEPAVHANRIGWILLSVLFVTLSVVLVNEIPQQDVRPLLVSLQQKILMYLN